MSFFWLVHPTFNFKEAKRVSQVPDASLIACHALGPRQSLGNLTIAQCSGQALQRVCDSFVQASGTLKPSPTVFCSNEAELLKGGAAPLRPTVFPVYASRSLFLVFKTRSADRATLGTGWWLTFTRWGLPAQGTRTGHPIRSTKLRLAHERKANREPPFFWGDPVERLVGAS